MTRIDGAVPAATNRRPSWWRALAARLPALVLVVVFVGGAVLEPFAASGRRSDPQRSTPKRAPVNLTIVVLADGADPLAAARQLGAKPVYVYSSVFSGFAAELPAAAASTARRSSLVAAFSPDSTVRVERQTVPTGVSRIAARPMPKSNQGRRGKKQRSPRGVNADVAILDTGISKHRDLNVRSGTACMGRRATGDRDGHGTHVAGIVGALNNRIGVVGVAPGARLWAVKVLDASGAGTRSSVICGLDWVYKHRGTIDVVNLSLSDAGEDGPCVADPFHQAVCRVVAAGIPVIVAAGNQTAEASTRVPAAWPETIAVSSFADTDGQPGGLGPPSCNNDDTRSWFSNYGPAVDIAAPGECIRSTYRSGQYRSLSGTSQATPHVAGAAARYMAANPTARPDDVRDWLLTEASRPQDSPEGFTGDIDGAQEPVLYLGS